MPGKRKADDMASSESRDRPSKAARLKAARERASQYAKRDKESLEKQKAKKNAPAASQKHTKATTTEAAAPKAAATKSPDKTMSTAERKRVARENAKKFAARDMKKLESKKKSSPSAVGLKKERKSKETKQLRKSSGKQQKTEAIAPLALDPAETNRTAHSIEPMRVVESTPSQGNFPHIASYQNTMPNYQNFGVDTDPTQIASLQHHIQQHQFQQHQLHQHQIQHQMQIQRMQELAWRQQQQEQREALQQLMLQRQQQEELMKAVSIPMFQEDSELFSASQIDKTVFSSDSIAPQAATKNNESHVLPSASSDPNIATKAEVDDVGKRPPSDPSAQTEVSQVISSNALIGTDDSVHQSSPEKEKDNKEGKEKHAVDDENGNTEPITSALGIEEHSEPSQNAVENEEKVESTKRKMNWRQTSVAVIVALLAIVFFQIVPAPNTDVSQIPDENSTDSKEMLCYFDFPESEVDVPCLLDGNEGVECPERGVCENGYFVGCVNQFENRSDQGDKCVLNEDLKRAITNQLMRQASQICDQTSEPKFKYSMLQEIDSAIPETNDDVQKVLREVGFVVEEREDGLYVALPEDFNMSLPIHCAIGNIGQWFLEKLGLLILGLFGSACSFAWAYKKLSLAFATLFLCGMKYHDHLATKARRQEDVKRTRALAYKTLEESPAVDHWAIHIRDEIALALYPDSKKLRLTLRKDVWPKIVDDVKRDTRIRKCQKLNEDGNVWDKWQWTAVAKSSSES
ncbi:unnamed protein product [Pseudo-nitzschia multistriata]|uniref:Man1/Src1 C-terminal domain-containing protein n=1 Tax=Pseudo-nitzschia multistriata TaxID=183589 RepID=A0A448ZFJ5_9STRA|nr:unnamed protein product [Pseudo-nitzschia multistriata]